MGKCQKNNKSSCLSKNKPNLLRVCKELAKFENPYKAADILVSFIKRGPQNGTYPN